MQALIEDAIHQPEPQTMRSTVTVWIVDDNLPQRNEVCNLVSQAKDLRCIGTFNSCEAMFEFIEPLEAPMLPDVVVMDYQLATEESPGHMNGIEGARRLKARFEEVAIVMLTINDSTDIIFESIHAGACGFLRRPPSIDELIAAIRQSHQGGMWMPPMVAQRVYDYFEKHSTESEEEFTLSNREIEVLKLMESGLKQKQIANEIHLSVHTIDSHLRNIYKKMHVSTSAAALAKAIRGGYI